MERDDRRAHQRHDHRRGQQDRRHPGRQPQLLDRVHHQQRLRRCGRERPRDRQRRRPPDPDVSADEPDGRPQAGRLPRPGAR